MTTNQSVVLRQRMNNKEQIDVVYLNSTKDFDSINSHHLMTRLTCHCGEDLIGHVFISYMLNLIIGLDDIFLTSNSLKKDIA